MGVFLVDTTVEKLKEVIRLARETDKQEAFVLCWPTHDSRNPDTLLSMVTLLAYANSYHSKCIYHDDGTPLMAYGFLAGDYNETETVWAVCTHHVEDKKYKRLFIAESRRIVAEIMEQMPDVGNIIWRENKMAIRWLKYVGAEFEPDSVQSKQRPYLVFKVKGKQSKPCLLTGESD